MGQVEGLLVPALQHWAECTCQRLQARTITARLGCSGAETCVAWLQREFVEQACCSTSLVGQGSERQHCVGSIPVSDVV